MTDSEADSDPSQQRKRIPVACGRCRKRKIKCSGDPGGGQPCTNCKTAGTEPCLFLRVSSSVTAFRTDPNDFSYSAQDAKMVRNMVPHGMDYSHPSDLSPAAAHDLLNPYRGGSAYGNYAPKSFYQGVPAYPIGYVEELPDYSLHGSPQPVISPDMVSYPSWTSRSDYGYGGAATTTLVHRPPPSVAMDSTNFSLSSMAAHLPASSLAGTDRLLPAPSSRNNLVYPTTQSYKAQPPAGGAHDQQSPIDAAAVLADMASSSYGHSYDTSGLTYSLPQTSLHAHSTQSSRSDREACSPEGESIFAEHEHSLRSQGSAVELQTYTYGGGAESSGSSIQHGPAAISGTGGDGSASANGSHTDHGSSDGRGRSGTSGSSSVGGRSGSHHPYMAIHDSASSQHHHQHHHHHVPLAATAAVSGSTACAPYLDDPSGTTGGHGNTAACNIRMHGDARRAAVGGGRR